MSGTFQGPVAYQSSKVLLRCHTETTHVPPTYQKDQSVDNKITDGLKFAIELKKSNENIDFIKKYTKYGKFRHGTNSKPITRYILYRYK